MNFYTVLLRQRETIIVQVVRSTSKSETVGTVQKPSVTLHTENGNKEFIRLATEER